MISVAEASQMISEFMPNWVEKTPLIRADRDYPPFDRVMMDGIAVKFSDFEKGEREFELTGVCPAGEPAKRLSSGCLEVMTGAPLPVGADLVIPYEHLVITNGIAKVGDESSRTRFQFVHAMGSDCQKGDMVLAEGHVWNGPRTGIATSVGFKIPDSSPKVLIISTGDELVEDNPAPHQIRRSNAYAMKASLELNGLKHVTLHHLKDDPIEIASHYTRSAPSFDMLIYSGGVSKGKFDYLPSIWADLGVTKYFHEVAQKPGKPLWFGVDHQRKATVVGLPGNPVSSLVCLHRYIIPGRKMNVKLTENVQVKNKLTNFIPVKINFIEATLWATPLKIQNSGEFTALAESDGFVEFNGEAESYAFFPWRSF
jgi:molybdopterin molybdotransferase